MILWQNISTLKGTEGEDYRAEELSEFFGYPVPTYKTFFVEVREAYKQSLAAAAYLVTEDDQHLFLIDWKTVGKWSRSRVAHLALWQGIVQSVLALEKLTIFCNALDIEATVNEIALNPFVDGCCDLPKYEFTLATDHPRSHALFFEGVGLEELVQPPKSWRPTW